LVAVVDVPARLVARDAVADLSELDGLVAKSTLVPGEQVLTGRFAVAGDAPARREDGTEKVSLTLDPQRAVGGTLQAGDTVAVYMTVPGDDGQPRTVKVVDREVTVHRVDGGLSSRGSDSSGALAEAVGSTVTVTLALKPAEVPQVVAAMEAQTVWLSLTDSVADDTVITTTGDTK
jgi:pilus assembly protein CpaB